MTKRSSSQQSKHDKGVKKSADYYDNQGYKVYADISGYPTPPTINGRRPDLLAVNRKEKVIVEVETKDSAKADASQQAAFKRYADNHNNTRFRKRIV